MSFTRSTICQTRTGFAAIFLKKVVVTKTGFLQEVRAEIFFVVKGYRIFGFSKHTIFCGYKLGKSKYNPHGISFRGDAQLT